MPKLKHKVLRDLIADPANGKGYTGGDDPAKMLAFATSQGWAFKDPSQGVDTELPVDKWEFVSDEEPRKLFSIPTTVAAPENKNAPDDWGIKLEAAVTDRLKRLGLIDVSGRPVPVNPTKTIEVKSSAQRMYENEIACKRARFSRFEDAEMFRLWIGHKIALDKKDIDAAGQAFKKFGDMADQVYGKAYSTTSVTAGAALVPEVFIPELIRNVLAYGAFSQLTQVIQTNSPQIFLPRRTGGLTGYWPSENGTITNTNATYDNVALNAKTFAVLAIASNQLLNDSGINFVDATMTEISLSIAQMIDQCLLIANTTATYGGHTGFEQQYGGAATDAGYVVVGGTTAITHTITQLSSLIGRLPQYARANAKFTCTPTIRAAIFDRLAYSAGGLQPQQLINGSLAYSYLGFPIIENNVMSSVVDASATQRGMGFAANTQIDVLFGEFARASKLLMLNQMELATSSERGFDAYNTYFRGVARFHSVVHDVGTATAAGPVVSFWQN